MITIDQEFKDLIPPLDDAEYKQLEENIKLEGCRDPLILWNDILIDGHHRYRICNENNIRYKTASMQFANREEVKEWIIKNQWGRRNLTPYQRAALALKLESTLKEKAKQNQSAGGKGLSTLTTVDVRKEIAKVAGLSTGTISKVKRIEESATEDQRNALRAGNKTINKVFVEIENVEREEKYTERERAELETKRIIQRCLLDLDTTAEILEKYNFNTMELRDSIATIRTQLA